MALSHELTFTGQSVYELAFSDRFFAGDVIDRLVLQHIEPAVDPASSPSVFLEPGNQVLIVLQTAESSRRLHGDDRGKLLIVMLELHQYLDTVTPYASKDKF